MNFIMIIVLHFQNNFYMMKWPDVCLVTFRHVQVVPMVARVGTLPLLIFETPQRRNIL